MTTELEEQFFKAFGLKPYYLYYVFDLQGRKNEYCFKKEEFIDFVKKDKRYLLLKVEKRTPEITDRKLLELICILATVIRQFKISPKLNLEQLKYHILRNCINQQESIYTRVKALFKEQQ